MAKARPRGRDEVIEALMQSARKLIAERGPSVALRDIADDAGVSFGLVHHYLGTKEQLVDEVYRRATRAAAERVSAARDLDDALQLLMSLGDGTTARLIGWAVLEGRSSAAGFRNSPALELLAELVSAEAAGKGTELAEDDARVFASFAMVVTLAWRLFGETGLFAAGLDGTERAAYNPVVAAYLQRLAASLVDTGAPSNVSATSDGLASR
jgi:AcrR family transcriptional regulator